jgi:hypothetical protein
MVAGVRIVLSATPEQQEVILSEGRVLALFAGRRFGKSMVARNRAVVKCLKIPGFKYLLLAPSYSQIRSEFDAMSSHAALGKFISRTRQQPYPQIEFYNGSSIGFRSTDRPNLLRGGGYDEVWCDEMQDIDEEVVDMIIRPLIADRRGTLGFSGQFRGEEFWTYKRLYLPGQEKNQSNVKSWRYPTSIGYSFRSEEGQKELDLIKQSIPEIIYQQEFECIPTANRKGVFRPDDLTAIKRGEPAKLPENGKVYCVSLDLGRIADPSSYVVWEHPTSLVVDCGIRPFREKHEVTSQFIAELVRRYNNCLCIVDNTAGGTGGRAPVDDYIKHYRASIPNLREYIWTYQSKQQLINNLCLLIEKRQVSIPGKFAAMFSQLSTYEYEYRNGLYDFHASKGNHDDLVAALAMAAFAATRNWIYNPGALSASVYLS